MTQFDDITIEGFGSIVDKVTFQLECRGLNIMRGKTGSGKTTIPSALYYCLYGSTLKKNSTVGTWEELRDENFQGTYVSTRFRKGKTKYEVIRTVKYKGMITGNTKGNTGLYVFCNGKDISKKGKRQVQTVINDILGYSQELFINSIIFGQRLKRIIEESGPNKKKLFDEAFEVLFIDKARKITETERNKILEVIHYKNDELGKLEESLSDTRKLYKELIEFEKNFERNKKEKISDFKKRLKGYTDKLEEVESKLSKIKILKQADIKIKLDTVENKLAKLNKNIDKVNNINKEISTKELAIKAAENKKEKFKKSEVKLCYTCGSQLGKTESLQLLSNIDKEVSKLNKSISELSSELTLNNMDELLSKQKSLRLELSDYLDKLNNIKSNQRLKEQLEYNKNDYKKEITSVESEIKNIKNESLAIISSAKQKKKLKKLVMKKAVLDNEIAKLQIEEETKKWLIKDPLSNSGIKNYIFNSLLGKVNDKLTDYSKILGFRIEFGIDIDSTTKDFYQLIYKGDLMISYNDLSGGQKQLVDATVALAIHDIISSVRPTNILFLDEPFEGLDNDSIQLMAEVIQYKALEQSLYIITHHSSFNPILSNTIYFSLDQSGRTHIN